jgi:hypothetical protein
METQSISIAKKILQQIKFADRSALMAWGARNFIALPENKEFQGGVRFNVNGLKHKGLVVIELRWLDDYTVSFLNNKGLKVHAVEGVYCDMLVDICDWVEGK